MKTTFKEIIDNIHASSHNGGVRISGPVYLEEKDLESAVRDIALRAAVDEPTKADIQLLLILNFALKQ